MICDTCFYYARCLSQYRIEDILHAGKQKECLFKRQYEEEKIQSLEKKIQERGLKEDKPEGWGCMT